MVRRSEGIAREKEGRWNGDGRDKRGVLSWDDEKRMQCNIAILLILYAFIRQMAVIAIIPIHNLREKGI